MKWHTAIRAVVASGVVLGAAAFAPADAIRLSGFWIEDVRIEGITDGQAVYVTPAGGRVSRSLTDVEGLRLTQHPQLEQADAALAAGDAARASELFAEVREEARQDWLKNYAGKRLVEAQAAAGRPGDAVQTLVSLSTTVREPWFIPAPPVEAVRAASDDQKARIADSVTRALDRAATDAARGALRAIAEAAASPEPAAEPGAEGAAVADGDAPTEESAVPLPARASGPIVEQLRAGNFQQALELADRAVAAPGSGLSENLYLRGVAQLALADASDDNDDYKDAGLSFMRVIVHFPRSAMVGPALVEAGYVHQKIGRPDLAQKLFDRARPLIDETEEPVYHQRLMTLMGQQ